jgi:hypothetical protein
LRDPASFLPSFFTSTRSQGPGPSRNQSLPSSIWVPGSDGCERHRRT